MKEFYTKSKNETTEIIEKKSKFIADIYPVKNVEEAENKIKEIKKKEYPITLLRRKVIKLLSLSCEHNSTGVFTCQGQILILFYDSDSIFE